MKDDRAIPTRIAAYGCMESILMSLGRKMNPEKLTTLVQILCASLPLLDAKGNSKTVKGRIKMDTLGVKDGKAMVVMVVMVVGAGTSAGAHALVVSFFFSLFFSLFFPPPVSLLLFFRLCSGGALLVSLSFSESGGTGQQFPNVDGVVRHPSPSVAAAHR
tara:strand:+ start:101 stop:580 length:480 start_codon:yes stop_codon:yes gene_type:complete